MSSLINCVVQPEDQYGLYHTYDSELFCLLSRTCISMFSWEIKHADPAYRLVTLYNIDRYKALLRLVDVTDTPEVFFDKLVANKDDLPLVYNTHDQLIEVAQYRLWQWQQQYRGKIRQSRNRIEFQFKSRLKPDQEMKLADFLQAIYRT